MRKILISIMLSTALSAGAQIINIPDPIFKNVLVNYPSFVSGAAPIDTNGDGEIQLTEAYNYGFTLGSGALNLAGRNITDFTGLNSFTTVSNLYCGGNNMTSLDLSGMSLTSFNLSTVPNLSSIIWPNPGFLKYVFCNGANLGAVDISGYFALEEFTVVSSHITNLTVNGCTALRMLTVSSNELTTLTLNNLPGLRYINCDNNQMTSINISNISQNGNFDLYLNQNQFTQLDVDGLNMFRLECKQNQFTTLNLGSCTQLYVLNCDYNPQLTYLNIKNGENIYLGSGASTFTFCPNLRHVCADEGETQELQNYFTQFSMPNVNVNPYCNFTPGGNSFNTVMGVIKYDLDNNGCSTSDPVPTFVKMKIQEAFSPGVFVYTIPGPINGNYTFYTGSNNYVVYPEFENAGYFTASPAAANLNLVGNDIHLTADFCLTNNGVHPDLEVVLIPLSDANPGFSTNYQMIIKNKGNQTLTGTASVNFDDSRLDFLAAIPAASAQSTGSVSWSFANLQPFEIRTIDISFTTLAPPANNLGDSLLFSAVAEPIAGDETPADNVFELTQPVTGSFDPNDKTCLQGQIIDISKVDEYVHYLVRFQNTGTDSAVNVVIKDILTSRYNLTSLQIINTSHPCILRQDLNKLEFIFENIQLPPQSINDAASNGYVAFKIKPAGTVGMRDSLVNNASIFFDYNFPIITNDAITVFDSVSIVPITMEFFKGQRKHSKHLLTWKSNCSNTDANFEIERSIDSRKFISIGNITASNTRCLQPFEFTDPSPSPGINYYRVKMKDSDGKITYSITIALINNEKGFELVNMLPNPVTTGKAVLNISSVDQQRITIHITDMQGRLMQSMYQIIPQGSSQLEMNFASLPAGMYNLTVSTKEKQKKTMMFVKK